MAFRLIVDGHAHEINIVRRKPNLVLRIDGREHEVVSVSEATNGRHTLDIDGTPVSFARARSGDDIVVRLDGHTYDIGIVDLRAAAEGEGGGQDAIKAPMPGTVVSVQKSAGDVVQRGETLLTIESMKLQMAIAAPRDGTVAALLKHYGETFEKDEIIVRLEPLSGKV
jgi:biotin carboxyl carrier protein